MNWPTAFFFSVVFLGGVLAFGFACDAIKININVGSKRHGGE